MGILHRQRWCGATGLLVPLLTLASPGFLKIAGIAPSWAVLWLLPWALVDGPASGAVAGLALGLVLDGLHLGSASEVPVLVLLGWWWGRIGRRGAPIERSFSLGLLALVGTALLGGSLWLQLHWQGAATAPGRLAHLDGPDPDHRPSGTAGVLAAAAALAPGGVAAGLTW